MFKDLLKSLFDIQKGFGMNAKHLSFDMSIWYVDGKVVSFLSSDEGGTMKVFNRKEVDLSKWNGRLPKSFFETDVKCLENEYIQENAKRNYTDDDENKEWTNELLDLYGFNGAKHRLIYSTDMRSMKESDYYLYRECFPADWEDCFEEKDFYFVITDDVGLRGTDENGKTFKYTDGYFKVRAISFRDAYRFYEIAVCKNMDYDKDYTWECGLLNLNCDKVFRDVLESERSDERYVKQFEEFKAQYITGKKCFGEFNAI